MIAALAVSLLLTQSPELTLRRFALIAGANEGGGNRVSLRYAGSDARSMAKVLTQLGGVDARDVTLLEEPTPEALNAALDALDARVREAKKGKERIEVFFYYSGHSDEEGLLLRGDRVSYAALRTKLDALPVDVRVAVLDSCASGALNLLKGGAPRPSFLVDASSSLSGHAFLTSASADEAAQESERLKASIFTHYFLSGLRGAADATRDGRVTLAEAYQYAFTETLSRTTTTRAGPQRPNWDIQLVGTGDLVLTDLRAADASLVIDGELGGRVHVLSATGGLVVEVAKPIGKAVELGLEVGEYKVVIDDGAGHVGETKLFLKPHASQRVGREALTPTSLEATVRRGDEPRSYLPVEVAFVPPISIGGWRYPAPHINFGLGILAVRAGSATGAVIGSVGTWVDDDIDGAAIGGVLLKTGRLRGVGIGGVALVTTGSAMGFTATTVGVTAGRLLGVHAAAVSIASGGVVGAQVAAVNVAAGPVLGTQLSAVNWASELVGFQAGALNRASDVIGIQAGAANVSASFFGIQAGSVNVAAGPVWGAQLGVVNVGGDVTGTQVGVINIAGRVTGAQVGVVNIGKSGVPIGLVNILTNGRYGVAAWANETSVANLAVKMGGENVYSFVVAGVNPRDTNGRPLISLGAGLGVRLRFDDFYGELEGSFETLHRTAQGTNFWAGPACSTGLRLNVGYQLWEHFAVFAGAQLHTHITFDGTRDVKTLSPWGYDVSSRVRLVPGLVLGIQVL
ncbi:MAG: caspase family protein [Myxococcaceae bacterium]|nr:caspase family protein [Myxococcaceae bacterium]